MTIYIILLLVSIVFGLFIKPNNPKRKRIYLIIVLGLVTLVTAARSYNIGIDLKDHYYNSFIYYSNKSLEFHLTNSPYDIGFILFYRLIYLFTSNPQWMIAVHSIIVNMLVGYFIYKNSDDAKASVFLYIAYNSMFVYMNVLRQALAIVFTLLANEFLKKKGVSNFVKYLLFMIIAVSMHSSALIVFLFPLFKNIRVNKKNVFLILLCSLIVLLLFGQLYNLITPIISIKKDYTSFYMDDIPVINLTAIYSVIIGFIALILSFFCIYKNSHFKEKNDGSIRTDYLVILVLVFSLTRLLRFKLGIMSRIAEYLLPYIWILFPRCLENIKKPKNRLLISILFYAFFTTAFIWNGYLNGSDLYGTVPYEPFWRR